MRYEAQSIFPAFAQPKGGPSFRRWPSDFLRLPALTDQLAHSVTFGQSQQVVLPFAISICAKVGGFASISPHNIDVHFLPGGAISRIERFFLGVDFPDGQFACDTPLTRYVADVSDVLMSTITIRFGNACHFKFFHCDNPFV